MFIFVSAIVRHLITGTRWYSVSTLLSPHLASPVRAAPSSSIYVSSVAPFLFVVVGEMIDRTENRSRRDSWERCIVLVCLVGTRAVFAQTWRLGVVLCYRRSRSLYWSCVLSPPPFSLSLCLPRRRDLSARDAPQRSEVTGVLYELSVSCYTVFRWLADRGCRKTMAHTTSRAGCFLWAQ